MVEIADKIEAVDDDASAPVFVVTLECSTEAEADAAETAARRAIEALRSRTAATARRMLDDETRRAGAVASAAARGHGPHEHALGRQFGNGSARKFHG
jgi:hypothetical protein